MHALLASTAPALTTGCAFRSRQDGPACAAWFQICMRAGHTRNALAAHGIAKSRGFAPSAYMLATVRQIEHWKRATQGQGQAGGAGHLDARPDDGR